MKRRAHSLNLTDDLNLTDEMEFCAATSSLELTQHSCERSAEIAAILCHPRGFPSRYVAQIHGTWVPDMLADVVEDLPDQLSTLGFCESELDEMLKQLKEADAAVASSLSEIESFTQDHDSERYIGFNLNSQRRQLLETALVQASTQNQDQQNHRAGCLEVILRGYLNFNS